MAEWFKAAVLKTARGRKVPRGFESHPFRQVAIYRPLKFSEKPLKTEYIAAARWCYCVKSSDTSWGTDGGIMGMRSIHRLTDREARTAKPGLHADGGCLYLQVSIGPAGNLRRSWLFRFTTGQVVTSRTGRPRKVEREMGLGGYPDVGPAEARERATNARRQIEQGIDPITERRNERASLRAQNAKAMTFDQCRDAFVAGRRETWRNTKHADQWTGTLETHVTPVFGSLPVQTVDVGLVTKVIEPLWSSAPETGNRERGRIDAILNWATVRGYTSASSLALLDQQH